MRAFITACFAIVVIAAGGYFFLNSMQQPSGLAYATDGARINAQWSWRPINVAGAQSTVAKECEMPEPFQWVFIDFGSVAGEPAVCSISQ